MVIRRYPPEHQAHTISISVDGVDVSPGTEVSFVLKRHGKVDISPCAEVWDDGVVYWDAKCSQVNRIIRIIKVIYVLIEHID